MYAKKSLGQHFLKSDKALAQIVEAAHIYSTETILEIGPGKGALTKLLLEKAGTVIAIEKDPDLIPLLTETFAKEIDEKKLILIEGDVLKFNPAEHKDLSNGYKLVANIPYYITGAIIEQFLSTIHQPKNMVLLMQKEVAERIVSRDGKQSVLSIAISAYGTPKLIAKVPAGAFVPAPKVDSAILLVENISRDFFRDTDEQKFFTVMKNVFGKKRKQIGGSLTDFIGNRDIAFAALEKTSLDPKTRPEEIALSTWKKLVQALS